MVAVHGVWRSDDRLALWAEGPGRHGLAPESLTELLAGVGPGLGWLARRAAPADTTLLMPGRAGAPLPSPELLGPGWAQHVGTAEGLSLDLFAVPSLVFAPEDAAQLLGELWGAPPALGAEVDGEQVDLWVGASLRWLVRVHDLAWRIVREGAMLPALLDGRARWVPATTGPRWAETRGLLRTAPPVARAEGRPGTEVLGGALEALVDAEARLALREQAPLLRPGRSSAVSTPAAEAWVAALTTRTAVVEAAPDDLHVLGARLRAWHRSLPPPAGELRLCLRLVEPLGDDEDDWSVDLLLQRSSEPSLLLPADDPDVAGELITRAAAVWPTLRFALHGEPVSTLRLDREGALGLLLAATELTAAGVGVLLPSWWRAGGGLSVALSARPHQPGAVDVPSLLRRDVVVDFDWRAAVGAVRLREDELRELAAAGRRLVRVRGQWLEVDPAGIAQALEFLSQAPSGSGTVAEVLRMAARPPAGVSFVGIDAEGWLADVLAGAAAVRVADVPVPPDFGATLSPYQQRGLDWLHLMTRLGLGAVLADDMGLGKTAQVLALLAVEHAGGEGGPTLVVCPMSVVGSWQREAARFAPGLRVQVHHGATRSATFDADVVVTTYGLVHRDHEVFRGVEWHRLVLDEAQNVKNSATLQARAVRSLTARHRLVLTGTPVENRLADLHSMLDQANPGMFGTPTAFKRLYSAPVERDSNAAALASLRTLTAPFVLRRLKSDPAIARQLPEKQDITVWCNLTAEQAAIYRGTVDDMLQKLATRRGHSRRGVVLSALTRLKQVCNSPALALGDSTPLAGRSGKLARLEEVLEEALAEGDRALCFTQYAAFGSALQPHLARRLDCEIGWLHGGTPRAERDRMVERFQAGEGPPVLLMSLKAGGTGITLTAANHVMHIDRWWNPAVEDQATDRAHRLGQAKDVQVRRFVCIGTVEERIDTMIERKRVLADSVQGGADDWLADLSTDALAELVALSADSVAELEA
ncbi:DEAD/DEAH box helicase [Motilibacter peucedani]|nr:DEAD/DEAH box helicase [Motilibacter peucedani]